jgi:hypothetical protein
VEKVAPEAFAAHQETGLWPIRPDHLASVNGRKARLAEGTVQLEDGETVEQNLQKFESSRREAPHHLEQLPDKRWRVTLRSDDGDVTAGVGKTVDEALDALEKKLR